MAKPQGAQARTMEVLPIASVAAVHASRYVALVGWREGTLEAKDSHAVLPADEPTRTRLPYLQVLRGAAATAVVLDHGLVGLVGKRALGVAWVQYAYQLGWLGVATFFVTSGLIMYRTSRTGFGHAGSAISFLVRRMVRVAPLYWFMTIAFLPIARMQNPASATFSALWRSLLFVPYRRPGTTAFRPILEVGWTLNYEMFFYLIFAGCLLLPRRAGLITITTILSGLVVAGSFHHSTLHYLDPKDWIDFYTDPIILLFASGVILGIIEERTRARRLTPTGLLSIASATVVLNMVLFVATGAHFPLNLGWQIADAFASMVLVLVCTSSKTGVRTWITRSGERLGDVSYSTYLTHTFTNMVALKIWFLLPFASANLAVQSFLAISVVAANAVGLAVFGMLESPVTRALKLCVDGVPVAFRLQKGEHRRTRRGE